MLKILHSYRHATSIFDDFSHYEKRQAEEDQRKTVAPVSSPGGHSNDYENDRALPQRDRDRDHYHRPSTHHQSDSRRDWDALDRGMEPREFRGRNERSGNERSGNDRSGNDRSGNDRSGYDYRVFSKINQF